MSSSDSDYSIDWLASDEEDAESEQNLSQQPDCVRRPTSTTTTTTSSPSFARGGKRCPSPPLSEDSQASSCARQGFCEGSGAVREEEEEEEEDERRGVVGMSDGSTCSSPSSYTGSCDGAEERLGGCVGVGAGAGGVCGGDKPRHPWGVESPKKRLAHKRTRSSLGPDQKEERPLTPLQSEKDRLFASKCTELQSYIPSLSSILNGLRSGRYRERLSSFQESVAMDRIQRIMGVLQNPHMGERYVNIILKVEEMLKSWFPHIKPIVQHADKYLPGGEMEPLSKKHKLSPGALARPVVMVTPVSGCVVHAAAAGVKGALCVRDLTPPGPYSATNLKWLHTSPICSLTSEQAQGTSLRTTTMASMAAAAAAAASATAALPAQHDQDLTQDNSVSSSTDAEMNTFAGGNSNNSGGSGKAGGARGKTDSLSQRQPQLQAPPAAPGRPPPGKINAPCLERLLKATESIITQRGSGGVMGSGWS